VGRLVALGHSEIGFLQLTQNMNNYFERQLGWRDALHSAGLIEGPVFTYGNAVNSEQDDLYLKIYEWLTEKKPTATAYLAANDYMALAALRALRMYGKKPGENVAVIGFDDSPFAQLCDPSLTTIRIDEESLGSAAADRLLSLLRRPQQRATRTHVTLPLIIRESICSVNNVNK
jgi:LacI family transcriptional regulator